MNLQECRKLIMIKITHQENNPKTLVKKKGEKNPCKSCKAFAFLKSTPNINNVCHETYPSVIRVHKSIS